MTHLLQLPAESLACVVSHAPLQHRLGSCSLASRAMHAAAVAATPEIQISHITQDSADAVCAWLCQHGSKALRQLQMSAGTLVFHNSVKPSAPIAVSLPC
jgi:hypothetical protein